MSNLVQEYINAKIKSYEVTKTHKAQLLHKYVINKKLRELKKLKTTIHESEDSRPETV